MQQFFTNTLESKFIKSLLYNTPLPLIATAKDGDRILKGFSYVYKNSIIKCTDTGILLGDNYDTLTVSEDLYVSEDLILASGVKPASYEVIVSYRFGQYIPQLTEKFMSHRLYYDSDTHCYLGKYLRCIRDLYGIDLMSLYNCFNYKIVTNFYLTDNTKQSEYGYLSKDDSRYDSTEMSKYKLIAVPIKFNKKYTIAIDCPTTVLMKSVFYGNLGMLKVRFHGIEGDLTKQLVEINNYQYIKLNSMDFKQPYVYSLPITSHSQQVDEYDLYNYEKNLYLIIQLPIANQSSIVVLEGDYSDNNIPPIINMGEVDKIKVGQLNQALLGKQSLLQINDSISYAFSNRLIEYLALNVIDSIDSITENTIRVQKYMGALDTSIKGAWSNKLRIDIFNKVYNDYTSDRIDINGFVDKETEKIITRGWDV